MSNPFLRKRRLQNQVCCDHLLSKTICEESLVFQRSKNSGLGTGLSSIAHQYSMTFILSRGPQFSIKS